MNNLQHLQVLTNASTVLGRLIPEDLEVFMHFESSLAKLRSLLTEPNLSGALELIKKLSYRELPDGSGMQLEEALRSKELAVVLHLRSLAAEICDYKGLNQLARDWVGDWGEICMRWLREVQQEDEFALENGDALLQICWVCLQGSMTEYRNTNLESSLEMATIVYRVASSTLLNSVNTPHFGVRARALYQMGLVRRERYELREALVCLTASTELAYESFAQARSRQGDRIQEDQSDMGRNSPMIAASIARAIGLGLASVHNTLGRRDLAVPLLMASKAMLPKGEKLLSAHIDLLKAVLVPQQKPAGDNFVAKEEDEAIRELSRVYSLFESEQHRPYQTRAAFYLAVEHLRRAEHEWNGMSNTVESDLVEAERWLEDLEFSRSSDMRFVLLATALRSDIARLRGQSPHAEELATSGLSELVQGDTKGPANSRHMEAFIRLLIARGRARVDRARFGEAIADFRKALEVAERASNYRLEAIMLLHMARTYCLCERYLDANEAFRRFETLKDFFETRSADVIKLESEARRLLSEQPPNFMLRWDDLKEAEDVEGAQKAFRRFLVSWAKSRSTTDSEAAELLKVSRQTLYNWLQG
jgi:tetratricopeptide (TPR) repeat protein